MMEPVQLKVTPEDLIPYLGRFVRFVTMDDEISRVGFLSYVNQFGHAVLDDSGPIPLVRVLAVYNIVNKKITGEGPEEWSLNA